MRYQISALQSNQLWIVYSDSRETAKHMAKLFRKEGYNKVTVKEVKLDA